MTASSLGLSWQAASTLSLPTPCPLQAGLGRPTICLHRRCRISESKTPALPTGSRGLLNSLQRKRSKMAATQPLPPRDRELLYARLWQLNGTRAAEPPQWTRGKRQASRGASFQSSLSCHSREGSKLRLRLALSWQRKQSAYVRSSLIEIPPSFKVGVTSSAKYNQMWGMSMAMSSASSKVSRNLGKRPAGYPPSSGGSPLIPEGRSSDPARLLLSSAGQTLRTP